MTDMPYVGPMTAGICFLMLAIFDQGRPLRRTQLRLGKRRIPWPHDWAFYLFLAIFALAVLPPLLLMTRQLGSFVIAPLKARVYGYVAFIPYYVLFAGCILAFAWTRSTRQLYLYGLYLTVGAATLAKGFVATGIVGIVVLSYLLVSNEWRLLARVELWRGAMIYVAACFPWWEANVIRHGLEFWNSLMGTEQVRRLLRGEQGHAKGPFEFYVRQFGWGGLPWSALVPVAFANAEFDIRGQGTEERQRRALRFVGLWLIATFVLFQLTITKYNHYILPCMPPAAILVGVYLDRILAGRARGLLLAVAISLGFFVFIARDMVTAPVRFVHFFTYLYTGIWADGVDRNPLLTTLVVLIGVAMALFAVGKLRRYAVPAAVVLSLAFTFVTLNRIIPQAAKNWSQQDMFRAYYQKRGSPSEDVIAWRLNWRGETFYSKANAIIFIDQPADKFRTYLAGKAKGTKVWLVTEKGNQNGLRDALPAGTARDTFRVEHSSIHFLLASAVL
jgi:4-amino-4-deoxy-L-arabinose transferase-like glycosyltransferase